MVIRCVVRVRKSDEVYVDCVYTTHHEVVNVTEVAVTPAGVTSAFCYRFASVEAGRADYLKNLNRGWRLDIRNRPAELTEYYSIVRKAMRYGAAQLA